MARRIYESEEIKQEYRRLRDRLYHAGQRQQRKYTSKEAYSAVKEYLSDITEVTQETLDVMQSIYNSVLDVNNVDPSRYDIAMYQTVRDMIDEMMAFGEQGSFEQYMYRQLNDMINSFVNSIGTKAFSDFIDNNPDVLHQIEVISVIYEKAMEEVDSGEREYKRDIYDHMEGQLNAALSAIEYLFNSYLNSEAYTEYKAWEAAMSAQFGSEIYD